MSTLEKLQKELTPIHKLGWRFIAIAAAITLLFWWQGTTLLSVIGLLITIYLILIFRNAPRIVPTSANDIVAPCDGFVTSIEKRHPPHELGLGDELFTCITIIGGMFESIVHRSAIEGRIEKIEITPGHGFPSVFGTEQGEREKLFMTILHQDEKVGIVMTSGWLPNQSFKLVQSGESLFRGQHVALAAPKSSLEIFFPPQLQVQVGTGSRVVAGETVLAMFGVSSPPRQFIKV